LTNEQRVMLRPLAATWDSLASAHKSKWISVAHGVASRPALEQKKMQERMAAWAALTPVERERARLNFAETKKLSPTDRATEWAAYQELSAEEKKRLAEKSKPSPMGAAIALPPLEWLSLYLKTGETPGKTQVRCLCYYGTFLTFPIPDVLLFSVHAVLIYAVGFLGAKQQDIGRSVNEDS
jgi:hypothetical protein